MSTTNPNEAPRNRAASPQRRRTLVTGLIWAAVVVALLAVARWQWLRPSLVTTVQPQRGPLVAEVFGTGTLEAKVVVALSTKITGRVTEVLVDQGKSARRCGRSSKDCLRAFSPGGT